MLCICHICQWLYFHIWDSYISIYVPYELTVINNVTTSTGIHTFHIIGICLWKICLPHCTFMFHCTSYVVYIWAVHYCTHPSKSINYNIYLPYYYKLCATNGYASQIPYVCHMPNILDVQQWGKNYNIYVTCELTDINHVTGRTVHRWQWWWHRTATMMLLPQPDYIYWVGHLAKTVKVIIKELNYANTRSKLVLRATNAHQNVQSTICKHKITDLNKSKDRKIIKINNSCIPQMGVCKVTIINKGIKYQSIFFLVSGNRLALFGMPDCERLQLLSINCQAVNKNGDKWMTKQNKKGPKINKDFKINPHHYHKITIKIDYFISGLEREANMAASTKTPQIMHDYSDVFTGIGCLKGTFVCRLKMMWSHIWLGIQKGTREMMRTTDIGTTRGR